MGRSKGKRRNVQKWYSGGYRQKITAEESRIIQDRMRQSREDAAELEARLNRSDYLVVDHYSDRCSEWKTERNHERKPYLFDSNSIAESYVRMLAHKGNEYRIRGATDRDIRNGIIYEPMDTTMPTELKFSTEPVELYDDPENRRFALASRAADERSFLSELAKKLSQSLEGRSANDSEKTLAALLPLAVDICCKYRGYKVDRVYQRMMLVAGDLEMPGGLGVAAESE